MRYETIDRHGGDGEALIRLRDTDTGAVVEIRPECGGTVTKIALAPAGAHDGAVDVMEANPGGKPRKVGQRCHDPFFPGRILWPFSDRIPHGIYLFEGQDYHLPINDTDFGDAIHGFIYDRRLLVTERSADDSETTISLLARLGPSDVDGYTFAVDLEIEYRLDASGFELSARGYNRGGRPAPVGLGWHPYFALPDVDRLDELILTTNANRYVPVDERLLPTGAIEPVGGTRFDFREREEGEIGTRELDVALTTADHGAITTHLRSQEYTLTIEQGGAFAYQQLFTPPGRRAIAIEPVTAATNAFNRPDLGLILLHHDQSFEARCRISLTTR